MISTLPATLKNKSRSTKASRRASTPKRIFLYGCSRCFGVIRQQTNDLCVRSSSVFLFGLGNAEESGIGRSKTLRNGSRPSSKNMRRLVSASSIPAGKWGMRLPIRLDMPEKRIMGNAFSNIFWDELCCGVNRQILREKLKELGWLARNRYGMLMETKWIRGRNKRGICFVPQRWEESELGLLSVTRG